MFKGAPVGAKNLSPFSAFKTAKSGGGMLSTQRFAIKQRHNENCWLGRLFVASYLTGSAHENYVKLFPY